MGRETANEKEPIELLIKWTIERGRALIYIPKVAWRRSQRDSQIWKCHSKSRNDLHRETKQGSDELLGGSILTPKQSQANTRATQWLWSQARPKAHKTREKATRLGPGIFPWQRGSCQALSSLEPRHGPELRSSRPVPPKQHWPLQSFIQQQRRCWHSRIEYNTLEFEHKRIKWSRLRWPPGSPARQDNQTDEDNWSKSAQTVWGPRNQLQKEELRQVEGAGTSAVASLFKLKQGKSLIGPQESR